MERFACASPEIRITLVFWLTSKMSHERGRRDSCASRRRDGRDRWLWRLVRPILHWEVMSHFKLESRLVLHPAIASLFTSKVQALYFFLLRTWKSDEIPSALSSGSSPSPYPEE